MIARIRCPKCKQDTGEPIVWGTSNVYYCTNCSNEWLINPVRGSQYPCAVADSSHVLPDDDPEA